MPRQIGQGVLYVKLKARRHRSAGHSLKKLLLLQRNSGGVPPSKLRCTLGAKGKEGETTKESKTGPSLRVDPGLDGTERCLLSCGMHYSRPTEMVSLIPRVSGVVLQRQLPSGPVGPVDGTGRSRCFSLSARPHRMAPFYSLRTCRDCK